MKKVDYSHFARFLMPHSLARRGNAVYFCVRQADLEENKYKSDLYVLKEGRTRRLTYSGDVNAFVLEDGGIVFDALRNEKDRKTAEKGVPLTVRQCLPYDGGEAYEQLRLGYSVTDLKYAGPDRFFFTAAYSHEYAAALSECGGDPEKAAAKRKDDGDYQVLDEIPFWFNGQGFINKTRNRLYVWEGGEVRPLTDEYTNVDLEDVSPDGKTLYYTASRYTDRQSVSGNQLLALDTESCESTDLSIGNPDADHYGAECLPDGRLLVLIATHENHGLNENPRLYIRENGAYRLLLGDGSHCFANTVGSDIKAGGRGKGDTPYRNGEYFFIDTQGGESCIFAVNCETGALRRLTGGGFNITDFILGEEGLYMIAEKGNAGCELYSVSDSGETVKLTSFSDALCAEYAYSEPRPISFTNEKGSVIEGWVIAPVGLEEGKKYPAILDIHGGPKTVYGSCYFHEMQLWASRGFAVMFCNPTGSDGGGDAFADIFGHYGEQDYKDLMDFVDLAIERFGFIDPDRLGVTGGSYGGFMTNWIIGHTTRFRAAASQRSISNWLSFSNTSDIGPDFALDQVHGSAWENMELIWAQSPLKYADKVTTPTLFIHSDEDYRCPLSEGVQMFTALKVKGVPARMCIFKGENHELSRSGKPKHRVRRLKEITEWMEKYL